MRVKSGTPPGSAGWAPGAAVRATGAASRTGAGELAALSEATRIRPVTTRPARKLQTASSSEGATRLSMSPHVNVVDAAIARLGQRDGEHAVLQLGRDGFHVDGHRQREGAQEPAVPPFDPMILFARGVGCGGRPRATDDNAKRIGLDLDVRAREAGHLCDEDEFVRRLVKIHRRRPAGGLADERPELFVEREQVSKRIPLRKGHGRIVARSDMCYDPLDIASSRSVAVGRPGGLPPRQTRRGMASRPSTFATFRTTGYGVFDSSDASA